MISSHFEEVGVLGGLMLWPENVGKPLPHSIYSLRPEFFEDNRHKSIWNAITELLEEDVPVEEIAVCKILDKYNQSKLNPYVFQLIADCPTCVNLDHWAKLLLENGRQKLISNELFNCVKRFDGTVSSADMTAEIREKLRQLEPEVVDNCSLASVSKKIVGEVKTLELEAERQDIIIAKTGIKDLDRKVRLKPQELTIIAGRPGIGKTAVAGCIAANVAKTPVGTGVALFSLEMSTSSIIRRLMSAKLQQSTDRLPDLARSGELGETANEIHGLNLWIDDRPRLTVDQMRSALRAKCPEPRLIIVDYLQLAGLDRRLERHDLRVGAVTKGLKALSKDFDCHVMALSQLNREVEKRKWCRPQISDLRDSGNIEEDADHVWLLYRPSNYKQDADRNLMEIIIAKQRNGPTGMVEIKFWPEYSMVGDYD